jgi:hypothetical protein
MPALVQSLISSQGDGSALSNSGVATSILPAHAKLTLPANYLDYIGRRIKVHAQGNISNIVTTPGTLTLDLRLGATVVFNGGAMQLSTTAHTTVPWWWDVELTLRAVGSSANFMGQGKFTSQAANISSSDPTTGHSTLLTPNTTPAVGSNFDSTTALVLDLFATFSIANAGNAIAVNQYEVLSNVQY